MRQQILDTQQSSTAITFVDALSLIRGIRSRGKQCTHYQAELLELLNHPHLTRQARKVIEQALSGELKNQVREKERAQKIVSLREHGKALRVKTGERIHIEFKTEPGFFWEPHQEHKLLLIEPVLGASAKPGHETFQCTAQGPGSLNLRWEQRPDARYNQRTQAKSHSTRTFWVQVNIDP